jgi:hypothetical protein
VAAALLADPELVRQAGVLLRRAGVLAQKSRSGELADKDVDLGVNVLTRMAATSQVETVRAELETIRHRLAGMRGATLAQAVEDLMARAPAARGSIGRSSAPRTRPSAGRGGRRP